MWCYAGLAGLAFGLGAFHPRDWLLLSGKPVNALQGVLPGPWLLLHLVITPASISAWWQQLARVYFPEPSDRDALQFV